MPASILSTCTGDVLSSGPEQQWSKTGRDFLFEEDQAAEACLAKQQRDWECRILKHQKRKKEKKEEDWYIATVHVRGSGWKRDGWRWRIYGGIKKLTTSNDGTKTPSKTHPEMQFSENASLMKVRIPKIQEIRKTHSRMYILTRQQCRRERKKEN